MKRILKILGIIVGAVVVLFVVAAVAVSLLFDPNDYKDEITAAVQDSTGRQLTLDGDHELAVFPTIRIAVGSATLSNAPGFGDEPMARIGSAELRVALFPLLARRVEISQARLEGLELNLARNWKNWGRPSGPQVGAVVVWSSHVGIITGRDVRFVTDLTQPVTAVMTPKDRLVTVKEGEARDVVLQKMHEKRVEKALVVDDSFHLLGMITVKDFQKAERKPNACKDEHGRLRVGAAVGAGAGNEERVDALVAAGVDVLLIDSSHGHSEGVLQRIRETRAKYPDLQIVGGNVATADGAKRLIDAGVDAVKVGVGPGSICITRIVAGSGVPQLTAVIECAQAAEAARIPIIADGGIRQSGDIAKALAAGAQSVMIGSMLAGTDESPGMVMTRRKVAENPLLQPIKPFRPRGQSGLEISDFLPEIAQHAVAVIERGEHAQA